MRTTVLNRQSTSEESKRRESVKSILQSYTFNDYNPILQMLYKLADDNSTKIRENLRLNQYSLKTALMMPIDEYVDIHPDCKINWETYTKYTTHEELYGLMIVIKKRNSLVFSFLWDNKGSIWWVKHLLPIVECIIRNEWYDGLTQLFIYKRTQEIFTSMYWKERRQFYEKLCTIAESLLNK